MPQLTTKAKMMKCPKCGQLAVDKKSNGRVIYYHTHYVDRSGRIVSTICIVASE